MYLLSLVYRKSLFKSSSWKYWLIRQLFCKIKGIMRCVARAPSRSDQNISFTKKMFTEYLEEISNRNRPPTGQIVLSKQNTFRKIQLV